MATSSADRQQTLAGSPDSPRSFWSCRGLVSEMCSFVVDDDTLLGELPGPTLAMTEQDTGDITEYVQNTPTARFDSPDTEVVEVFRANPESTVAVLDDGSILGDDPHHDRDRRAGRFHLPRFGQDRARYVI